MDSKFLSFNPLKHPVCLSYPARLESTSWAGHVPFAMFVVSVLRPRTVVELGVYTGVSYCAFCQAVKELNLDTRCYGIDTWHGDVHVGQYGREILSDLKAYHDPLYENFSSLIQSTFDDAVSQFEDSSIDLLHIDGAHSYEAVSNDFSTWLPKMSRKGVVLLHDINVRDPGFGVWKLWDEIKGTYSHFEFTHEHGLGVLAIGADAAERLGNFLKLSEVDTARVRDFFNQLGQRLKVRVESDQNIRSARKGVIELETELSNARELCRQREESHTSLQTQVIRIQDQLTASREEVLRLDNLNASLQGELANSREELRRREDNSREELRRREDLYESLQRAADRLEDELFARRKESRQREDALEADVTRLSDTLSETTWKLSLIIAAFNAEAQQLAESQQLGSVIEQRDQEIEFLQNELRKSVVKSEQLSFKSKELDEIKRSMGWRLLSRYGSLKHKYLLPLYRSFAHSRAQTTRHDQSPPQLESSMTEEARPSAAPAEVTEKITSSTGTELESSQRHLNNLLTAAITATPNPVPSYGCSGLGSTRLSYTFPDGVAVQVHSGTPDGPLFASPDRSGEKSTGKWVTDGSQFFLQDVSDGKPLTRDHTLATVTVRVRESDEPDFEIPRTSEPTSTAKSYIKPIAFYLPQFHVIAENEQWWGKGFTEWKNVRRGEPQFQGHYQPHVPLDLGYYDLSNPTVLEKQADLAQSHGIYGFCFYYYWFKGKVLLDRPIGQMLERGKPDIPFCICWANENWTRRWDGKDEEILIAQQHSPEDDLAFLRNVERILFHDNYIKIDGRPLLIVYNQSSLPDARATALRWRNDLRKRGLGEIFLAAVHTFHDRTPPEHYGFDASIQFPPHAGGVSDTRLVKRLDRSFSGYIYDYEKTKRSFIGEYYELSQSRRLYPGVMPSWDNTARLKNKSHVWINSSPESYYDWMWQISQSISRTRSPEDRFIFINAWNEWAEGCHLEPDQRFGYGWLNATKLAIQADIADVADSGSELTTLDAPQISNYSAEDGSSCSEDLYNRLCSHVLKRFEQRTTLDILFVSHDAHRNGAQNLLLTLASWLKQKGLANPRFLLAGPGALTEEFLAIGPVLNWEMRGPSNPDSLRLLRSFCGKDLSAVYINSAAAGHLIEVTRHLNVPHLAHVHELEKSIERWAGPQKMAALRKYADFFIAASSPVADNLRTRHGISDKRIRVVDSFIRSTGSGELSESEKSACKAALGFNSEAKIVLGCGTTDSRKGPDLFVQVAQAFNQSSHYPVQFVWVGGHAGEDIVKKVESLPNKRPAQTNLTFTGAVSNPLPFMLAADVFLLTSREDPFPLVCLESADCGVPIICFAEAGGMPEFVGSTCGAVVPYLDVDAMTNQLSSFIQNEKKSRELGAQARQKVRSEFDVSIKGNDIYEILLSMHESSNGHQPLSIPHPG